MKNFLKIACFTISVLFISCELSIQVPSEEFFEQTSGSEIRKYSEKNVDSEVIIPEKSPEEKYPCKCVQTIAGGRSKSGFKDGNLASAKFFNLSSITVYGNCLYVADTFNHRIRKVDLQKGFVTTLAGTGKNTKSNYKDGMGNQATFSYPHGVAFDSKKKILYVIEQGTCRIRAIDQKGLVTTVLEGCEKVNNEKHSRITIDATGQLYLTSLHKAKIYKFNPITKSITVIAESARIEPVDGTLKEATFFDPDDISIGPNGLIYVIEGDANIIRSIDLKKNKVTTILGNGKRDQIDGKGKKSSFFHVMDGAWYRGSFYFVDTVYGVDYSKVENYYLFGRLRKFDPSTQELTTISGQLDILKEKSFDGSLKEAQYRLTSGMTSSQDGVLYITSENYIRKIDLNCPCE